MADQGIVLNWLVAAVWGAALVGTLRVRPELAGSTLTAPGRWAALALVVGFLRSVLIALVGLDPTATVHSGLILAALGVAPTVALLGAKRPQDRAWGFIVLGCVVILSLPSLESWLLQPGVPPGVEGIRAGLALLIAIFPAINYLGSRTAFLALAVSGAQFALWLPYVRPWNLPVPDGMAPTLLVFSLLPAQPWRRSTIAAWCSADDVWRWCRDGYGLIWSARLRERWNAAAQTRGWPVSLDWEGFTPPLETIEPCDVRRQIEREWWSFARRFVDPRRLALWEPGNDSIAHEPSETAAPGTCSERV